MCIGRFCHNLRDEISMFFHLLTLLTIFPSYLADQKYCMLKDLGEHYPCAKSDEPTLINYEMAKWLSFVTYVTKSCRDKIDP